MPIETKTQLFERAQRIYALECHVFCVQQEIDQLKKLNQDLVEAVYDERRQAGDYDGEKDPTHHEHPMNILNYPTRQQKK